MALVAPEPGTASGALIGLGLLTIRHRQPVE
ncbi:MAG TPA: hypothetical protein DIU18_07150 [Gemmatimonadetes bacterium]|nr:hypothetical protein [Gemmatimonadota bacterium]